ncbi:hypothetical protein V2A60_001518 [Cordyceps javanica]
MDSSAAAKALDEARLLVAELESYDGTVEQHLSLLNRAHGVRAAMEGPYEIATRWLENMSCGAAMNLLIRIGAFGMIPPGGSIAAQALASKCNVHASVITRAVRVLVANGIFLETGRDEYAHNQRSMAFDPTAGLGGFVGVCADIMHAWITMPKYCSTHEPEDLYDTRKTPFAFTAGMEGMTYYEVLDTDPEQRGLWNLTLQNMAKNFPVVGMFPFQDLKALEVQGSQERPYIVDVGGGRGQALLAIQEDYTLQSADIPGIKPMVYDIFTPQPIHGKYLERNAHAYLMRRLLHDFHDCEAIEILRNTASAMAPDSRLLICDMLVPDKVKVDGPMTLYWLDFSLLAIGGKERSLAEFEHICGQAGLEIIQLYPSRGDNTIMLETRLQCQVD